MNIGNNELMEHIVAGFKIMRESKNGSPSLIEANKYFFECQKNPDFSYCLMQLFNGATDPELKKQCLMLLKNIIKRNWTIKRRTPQTCRFTEEIKGKIRTSVIDLYRMHCLEHYKLFNQIFKYVSKQDFPNNYESLFDFMVKALRILAAMEIQQFLDYPEFAPYLSTVKTVMKEYGLKRVTHNEEYFNRFARPIIDLSDTIFTKINNTLQNLNGSPQNINFKAFQSLLECSRKIDKIIMYSIQSSTSSFQKDNTLIRLCNLLVLKVQFMAHIDIPQLNDLIRSNILALADGLSKIQTFFPFLFTKFIKEYLNIMLGLLFSMKFDATSFGHIIKANKKPLTTYSYYIPPSEFESSIYCRKGFNTMFLADQLECHKIFNELYGGQNAAIIMNKVVFQLMPEYPREDEAELIFQDSQTNLEGFNNDIQPFDLLVIYAKDLLLRFKQQLKPFVMNTLMHLNNNLVKTTQSPIISILHQIVLVLPKIYEQTSLNLNLVVQLVEKIYNIGDLLTFPRYIRSYQLFFPMSIIEKSFKTLVFIISQDNVPHQAIFQCLLCIKKMINENQEDTLPIETTGACFNAIFKLLGIYRNNHNHLWNLLHLLNQFVKALTNQTILKFIPLIMQNINFLIQIKNNNIASLQAITNLLENVIEILSIEKDQSILQLSYQSNQLCIKHIEQSFSIFMNNDENIGVDLLIKLWLTVMKNHESVNSSKEFNQKLIEMYNSLWSYVMRQSPILFCEILEEYMLSGLFQLSSEDILRVFKQIKSTFQSDQQPDYRALIALSSVYYTYSLISNKYIPEIIVMYMQELRLLITNISPIKNALRTQLLLIISHHTICFGCQTIFTIFGNYWPQYSDWFWPIIWSLDYVNHRYACKVIAIFLLNSIRFLSSNYLRNPINQICPIDRFIKFLLNHLEPLKSQQAMSSYMNTLRIILHAEQTSIQRHRYRKNGVKGISRKIFLHVNRQWSENSLKQIFKQAFSEKFQQWKWNIETIRQRYQKVISKRLQQILN